MENLNRRDRLAQSSERRFSLGEWMAVSEWVNIKQAGEISGMRYNT